MDITSSYNYLPEDQWLYVVKKTYLGRTWQFDGYTNSQDSVKFWYMDLNDDEFFTSTLLDRVRQNTGVDWQLDTAYANGQTHGLSGELHQDVIGAEPDQYYTFLYYANPEWHPTWGGTTVFTNPEDGATVVKYPTPNSGVLFDSTVWHAGLEPTRHCKTLRVTVALKLHRP